MAAKGILRHLQEAFVYIIFVFRVYSMYIIYKVSVCFFC